MMRLIVLYVSLGYTVLSIAILCHMLNAELKGYNACEWWEQYMPSIIETFSIKEMLIWLLWVTFTWPVRVVQLRNELTDFYGMYGLKHGKRKVSH